MKLTSKQKKLYIPLFAFAASLILYVASLGSFFAILLAIPMSASAGWLLVWNAERWRADLNDWVNKDDIGLPSEAPTIERDMFGTLHIKLGEFDFVQVQYQYPYTDNAGTRALAEKIVALICERKESAP